MRLLAFAFAIVLVLALGAAALASTYVQPIFCGCAFTPGPAGGTHYVSGYIITREACLEGGGRPMRCAADGCELHPGSSSAAGPGFFDCR